MDRSGGGGENGCGQAVPSTLALEGVSRGMEMGFVVNHCCVSSSL